MLETKKSITITGHSVIDGKRAAEYRASIDETSPENMIMTNSQLDKEVYKENRVQCRKDAAEFEELAYSIQDQMIAKNTDEQGGSEE